MKSKKTDYAWLIASIISFLLLSISFLLMPIESKNASDEVYTFTLPANFRNKVSMTATDVAGNQSVITRTDRILVVDTDTPVLTVSYDSSKSGETTQNHNKNSINGKIYSNQSITVRFEITESNFDLRKQDPTFKIGSLPVALTWNKDTVKDVWYAEATMESEGIYDLVLNFADASGNAFSEYTQTVIVDKTAPIINDIEYTGTAVTGNIFNTNREAEITIIETNFEPKDVELSVYAEDITGNPVDLSSKDYSGYAKNPDNWTDTGPSHSLVLPLFDIDAIYTVDVSYADLAKNTANDYSADEFIIDKTPAKVLDITYSTPVWQKVLSNITFGAYKENVVITVTSEDLTSGVNCVDLTYTRSDNVSSVNTSTYKAEGLLAVQQSDKKTFVTTYTLPANARGTISAEAFDKATLSTSKDDKTKNVVVVDDKVPTRTVTYEPYKVLDAETLVEVNSYSEGDNSILYYTTYVKVCIKKV